jgi:hypothetical protein
VTKLHLGAVAVAGVGEPDAAVRVDDHVVRLIEAPAFEAIRENDAFAAGLVTYHAPPHAREVPALAHDESTLRIDGHAVRLIRVGCEDRTGTVSGVITHDAAGGDIGEQDGAAVPDGTLCELERAGHALEHPQHCHTPHAAYVELS